MKLFNILRKYCTHLDYIKEKRADGIICKECKKEGKKWVQLRVCLTCGHVGCCDSSEGMHARKHFHKTKHPIIRPMKNKDWKFCYIDDQYI